MNEHTNVNTIHDRHHVVTYCRRCVLRDHLRVTLTTAPQRACHRVQPPSAECGADANEPLLLAPHLPRYDIYNMSMTTGSCGSLDAYKALSDDSCLARGAWALD